MGYATIWSETLPTREYSKSFLPLFFDNELKNSPIRIIRLPAHMSYEPRIYEWTPTLYIPYSQVTSTTNIDFTSKGWIVNSKVRDSCGFPIKFRALLRGSGGTR